MDNTGGVFIVVEGVDGAGKTTQIKMLTERLKADGYDVVTTREPGGTPMAEEIRGVMLTERDEVINPTTELLLTFAARQQHLDQVLRPALDAGKVVICDRFVDSTYIYQIALHDREPALFYQLVNDVVVPTVPHFTYVLLLPLEESLKRTEERGSENRMDDYTHEQKETINHYYHKFSKVVGHGAIDCNRTIDAIHEELYANTIAIIKEVRDGASASQTPSES